MLDDLKKNDPKIHRVVEEFYYHIFNDYASGRESNVDKKLYALIESEVDKDINGE